MLYGGPFACPELNPIATVFSIEAESSGKIAENAGHASVARYASIMLYVSGYW